MLVDYIPWFLYAIGVHSHSDVPAVCDLTDCWIYSLFWAISLSLKCCLTASHLHNYASQPLAVPIEMDSRLYRLYYQLGICLRCVLFVCCSWFEQGKCIVILLEVYLCYEPSCGIRVSLRNLTLPPGRINIFIVTDSFLYWCVMRPASQRFFIHSCIYLRILIISYLATFLGTNSLSVLMCRKAVNRSILRGSVTQ